MMFVSARPGLRRALITLLALGGLSTAPALAQQAPGGSGQEAPPQAVTVETLVAQDITLTATLPGRVVASATAEVRPQVDGIIVERLFTEGSPVSNGDPLFQIDDATYRAKVAAAQAQVTLAEAQLRVAESEARRIEELVSRRVSSQQTLDEAIAARDTAAASLDVAKADLASTQIELERTIIRAPLSGIIGRSLATRGALVTNGQASALAVIRSLDPVLVDVTQSAAELLAFKRAQLNDQEPATTEVRLTLADGSSFEQVGTLTAAEPYVNEQTGVVTLRLSFANPDRLLLPGMYVQVEMPQGVARGAVFAPQEGVARDRRGRPTALVVGANDVVEERVLTIKQARGDNWIVTDGLSDGDRIIVAGTQKTRAGAKVSPQIRPTTQESRAAATPTQ
ncbi:MAG: efflux RND transporter periplasmic adaptor subunit [Neomegalonema sp.]|nr:efflux RND transporter periplasmic adaptor subunit [Neomegalonema sp.]